MIWALWLANVVLDTGGQLAFKRAASLGSWGNPRRLTWIALGASCYVLEFVAWIAFLSLVPLSRGVLLGSINIVTVAIAGALVGFGTRLSNGCTSGHGICGIARLSPRSLVATGVFMAAAIAVVAVTRHVIGG